MYTIKTIKSWVDVLLPKYTKRRQFLKDIIWLFRRSLGINLLTILRIKFFAEKSLVQHSQYCKKVSIIMLSLNRFPDTKKAIKNIFRYTKIPFELIILDNNSKAVVCKKLNKLVKKYHSNIKLLFEDTNLGCAGGRQKALQYATGDYIFFVDNDICVLPNYMENLIHRIEESPMNVAVCCKVILPNGKIQFNGGNMLIEDGFAIYSLIDAGLPFNSPETKSFLDCEWIPGGATLWKKEYLFRFPIDGNMKGSYEDNEVSFRVRKSGFKLVNSPNSLAIHNHFDFKGNFFRQREKDYWNGRYNLERAKQALMYFYQCHHLIFSFETKGNPWDVMFNLFGKEEILQFLSKK